MICTTCASCRDINQYICAARPRGIKLLFKLFTFNTALLKPSDLMAPNYRPAPRNAVPAHVEHDIRELRAVPARGVGFIK